MNLRRFLSTLALGATLAASVSAPAQEATDLASLRAKAEKGNAVAQYNLGLAYAEGRTAPINPIEAYVWLTLARENGARGRALDSLAATLSPAELETAKARLAERRTALGTPAPAPASTTDFDRQVESTLARVSDEKTALEKQVATLQQQNDQLKSQLAQTATSGDAEKLRRERDALATRVTDLAGDLSAARSERDHQSALAEEAARTVETTRAELDRAKQSIAALRATPAAAPADKSELEQKDRELRAARDDLQNSRNASEQLAAQLAKADNDRAHLEQMLTTAQTSAENAAQEIDQLKAKLAANPASPALSYPDLRDRVGELEAQVAALRQAPPAYPDLRSEVSQLRDQLAAAQTTRPSQPDLSGRVAELETQLAETRRQLADTLRTKLAPNSPPAEPVPAPATVDTSDLEKKLAESEDKLATSLRGYALLKKERDELAAASAQSTGALTTEKTDLAAQLAETKSQLEAAHAEIAQLQESQAALGRSSSDTSRELASLRALLTQQQGANATLAQENYQLKTALARDPNASRQIVNGVPRETPPPASAEARTVHTVASGDTLSKISQLYYGTPNRWQEIYNANRAILGPTGTLRIGTVLRIP